MTLRSFISRLILHVAIFAVVFWLLRMPRLIGRNAFDAVLRLPGGRGDEYPPAVERQRKNNASGSGRWLLPFLSRRDESREQEWMDLPGGDPHELADMFKDLRRVNHWLGGWDMTARGLTQLLGDHKPGSNLTILDVASGSADIPQRLSQHAQRQGQLISSVAIDNNPEVLKLAQQLGDSDTVLLVAADALRLPFVDDAYDVAACSFFLHHLEPEDVVLALREMRRVSRHGVVINDLVRSRRSYLGALLFTRLFTRNRISRHDAPLSARRAYTRAELIELAARAGLVPVAAYGFLGYRVTLAVTEAEDQLVSPASENGWSKPQNAIGGLGLASSIASSDKLNNGC
ncbi:MAG: methyltransferase domain-containing protein [Sphaerobacteraceae bacterium]|nr:MAG: methyltransferase domain-containing protein [Sphaerobacteraceae bacterium]